MKKTFCNHICRMAGLMKNLLKLTGLGFMKGNTNTPKKIYKNPLKNNDTPVGDSMDAIVLNIEGEVPSKKNMYRLGGGRFYQDAKVKRWMEEFFYQVRQQYKGGAIAADVHVTATFYITRDKDLDNLQNGLFDALQMSQVIVNDRQIAGGRFSKVKVKENPRVELVVAPYGV